MRRREFIMVLGGAATWPLAARPQQAGKSYRVALVFTTSPASEMVGPDPIHPIARAFVHALRDLGYVDGRNLVLERRSAEGKFERFPEIFRELVSIKADVIVINSIPATRVAKQVTQTVPIVALVDNPVEEGFIQSLARPGGNITGLAAITSLEIFAKRVQLLKELLPGMSVVAYLQSKAEIGVGWEQTAEAAARELGVKILFAELDFGRSRRRMRARSACDARYALEFRYGVGVAGTLKKSDAPIFRGVLRQWRR
jgi:putative ABC transport system substrate-binding protein